MELVLYYFASILLLLSSQAGVGSTQGAPLHLQPRDHPKIFEGVAMAESSLIGSRPPRCEGKCAPCGRCEAVQVPVAPRRRVDDRGDAAAGRLFRDDDGVDDDESSTNYKPLNWRCRCAARRALDP